MGESFMSCRCFVVNLENAVDRRKDISNQLENLNMEYEIFSAVNGRALPEEYIDSIYDKNKAISKAYHDLLLPEMGCALSHIGIYKKMIEQDIPYALILEDDALLGQDVPEVLDLLSKKIDKTDSHVVLLSYARRYINSKIANVNDQFKLAQIYRGVGGTHGYFLTNAAAKSLVNYLLPLWVVADKWEYFQNNKVAQIDALLPYCIGHSIYAAESVIQFKENREHTYRPIGYLLKKWFYWQFFHRLFIVPFWHVKKQKQRVL